MYNDWLDDAQFLSHSAKGTKWSKHKYIAIENGRYIYPDDVAGGNSRSTGSANQFTSQNRQNESYKGNGQPLFRPRSEISQVKTRTDRRREPHTHSAQVLAKQEWYRTHPGYNYDNSARQPFNGLFSAASNIARDAGRFLYDTFVPSEMKRAVDNSAYLARSLPNLQNNEERRVAIDENLDDGLVDWYSEEAAKMAQEVEDNKRAWREYERLRPLREAYAARNRKEFYDNMRTAYDASRHPEEYAWRAAQNLYDSLMNSNLDATAAADEDYGPAMIRNRRRR